MKSIRNVGIVAKKQEQRVRRVMNETVQWLRNRNVEVAVEPEIEDASADFISAGMDAIIVLGGDGTLLRAARLAGERGVPIVGINLGSLGFLTEVRVDERTAALEAMIDGRYGIEERGMLRIEVSRDESALSKYLALNDAVINKGALSRLIELEIRIGDQPAIFTRSDGLIISTPTGSTAYSLAAGGPIMYPTLEAVVVSSICPHSLTNRPLVMPDRQELHVRLMRGRDVMLTIDGQVGMSLRPNDCIRLCRADAPLKLLLPFRKRFFDILNEKLQWR
jgi:NAD+ kinase